MQMAPVKPLTSAPNNPSPRNQFELFLEQSHSKLIEIRGTRDYALNLGLTEEALERYTSGACSLYEQDDIERSLTKSRWATDYVINLVKSRRNE